MLSFSGINAVRRRCLPNADPTLLCLLHANDRVIFDRRQEVARHDRLTGRLEAHLELSHYVEALIRKTDALPGATAFEQARAVPGTRVSRIRRDYT